MPTTNTYNLEHKGIDLSPVINKIITDMPSLISLFPVREAATATKCEFFQDQLKGAAFTGTPATTGIITVDPAESSKVRLGMMLTIRDDSAVFRVTGVTPTQITVAFVAAHGSDQISKLADLPTTLTTFNITYDPIVEGSTDAEKILHQPGKDYNYTQIFRKDIELTGTAQAITTLDHSNSFTTQAEHALLKIAREINRSAIFGIRNDNGTDLLRTFGGLYDFGCQTGGLALTFPSTNPKTFNSGIVNDAAQLVNDAGGNANTIIVGIGQRRVLSAEYKNKLTIVREDKERGSFVGQIVSDSDGGLLKIIAEPGIPDTHAWVADDSGFGMRYLRPIVATDASTNAMDGNRQKILGELTLEFKNAKHRLCHIKGLKPSQDALAALNS